MYLDAIRGFEGFTAKADWDYAQFSNGYGTRARYAGEVIDKAEADRRFQAEIAEARAVVERHAPGASEGTKAALTSLTYNAGNAWTRSGLGEAVRSGDSERARELFVQYNKAGGEVLPGLARRRLAEAAWIGAPQEAAASGGAMAAAAVSNPIGVAAASPAADLALQVAPRSSFQDFAHAHVAPARVPHARETASPEADVAAILSRSPVRADEAGSATKMVTTVAGFAGEARLTQLLLASRLIGGASTSGADDARQRSEADA